ncbi:MAG: glycine zipper domain-containing protein [Alteripontixanthobacter sp.]
MNIRKTLVPLAAASALSLSACAENYAVEGAGLGAAAGAAAAAITGEDLETYALAGAAIGGIAGYFKDKDNDCDGFYDRNGRYVDDDCRNDSRYSRYFR